METVKFKDPVIMVVKSLIMVQPGTAEQRSTDCRLSVSSGGTLPPLSTSIATEARNIYHPKVRNHGEGPY